MGVYGQELTSKIKDWGDLGNRIAKRWSNWNELSRLMAHASGSIQDFDAFSAQVSTIEQQRQLLEDPDPIAPLIANLTQLLRDELNKLDNEYAARHEEGLTRLNDDANWQELEQEQRYDLMSSQSLHNSARPEVEVSSTSDVLATLDRCSLSMFADRVDAIPGRFDRVMDSAAEMCEPKVQFVSVSRRIMKTDAEIDAWAEEVTEQLKEALTVGPVSVR